MRFLSILLSLLIVLTVGLAGTSLRSPYENPMKLSVGGAEDPATLGPAQPPEFGNPVLSLDEPIGEVYVAGTTWYDLQHNGSAGKMIAVDDSGFVHLVWMNGLNSAYNPRHVYYNLWIPIIDQMTFGLTGSQMNASSRAGYTCLAVLPNQPYHIGWVFPAYHEIVSGSMPHSSAAMDYYPSLGAFASTQPAYLIENGSPLELIWPKIAVGNDSIVHLLSTHNTIDPVLHVYYSRGNPIWQDGFGAGIDWQPVGPGGTEFLLMDTAATVSADIAASKHSDRAAMAWTRIRPTGGDYQFNSDVFLKLSEDGGQTWGPRINLTHFAAQDTFRAYADVSLVYDDQDYLHVAFTTGQYTEEFEQGYVQKAVIWHWSEQSSLFSVLAEAWYFNLEGTPGGWMRNVSRPSLSIDPVTDFVYCSYQKFDTAAMSTQGYFNSDAWVTVSTDGGLHWSTGTNVTDTPPVGNPAAPGDSRSERDITLADRVTDYEGTSYLHLEWELDRDAGTAAIDEGLATQNTIYYQRIPLDEIPLSPLLPVYALHVQGSPTLGRCCYGLPQQPQCAMLSSVGCESLYDDWDWDSTMTCADPCEEPPPECTCQTQPNTHCVFPNVAIPDGDYEGIQVPIAVPIEYHITDVNVCLDVTHEYVGELVISLVSPQGTSVLLKEYAGYGEDLTCTSFDDEAGLEFWEGVPPYNGSFRPWLPLSAFDGENATGEWQLVLIDTTQFSTGTLNWVCLTFEYDQILPVDLISFDATAEAGGIRLAFRTASETNNDHFEILRGESEQSNFARIAVLPSQGNSAAEQSYSYLDEDVTAAGTYWYYLADVDLQGNRTEHRHLMRSATMGEPVIPLEYSLSAYPNPFNPETTVRFSLKEAGDVSLAVYNVHGQWIRDLARRHYNAGNYSVIFNANELPSGIYFARLECGAFAQSEKLVLLK